MDAKKIGYIALALSSVALIIAVRNSMMLKAMYSSPANSSFNGDDTLNCCGK